MYVGSFAKKPPYYEVFMLLSSALKHFVRYRNTGNTLGREGGRDIRYFFSVLSVEAFVFSAQVGAAAVVDGAEVVTAAEAGADNDSMTGDGRRGGRGPEWYRA